MAATRSSAIEKYNLRHGVLNLSLPPQTMWMNMGYWISQRGHPSDLPKACQALLERVLEAAGIIGPMAGLGDKKKIQLLDVGFGCGDQSIHLLQLGRSSLKEPETATISNYIGITKSEAQFRLAQTRLEAMDLLRPSSAGQPTSHAVPRAQIFCADAAQPTCWSSRLTEAVQSLHSTNDDNGATVDTWLLGLDTLFHFAPSRLPLLRYAHDRVHASFMAFDCLLADGPQAPSLLQRAVLRLICLLLSIPYTNLLTVDQYRRMLAEAGYPPETVHFENISEHVFGPLAEFLGRQDLYLRGIGGSIGVFRITQSIFAWWARTGIIRGYIVVARRDRP